jgi:hypothetical protein
MTAVSTMTDRRGPVRIPAHVFVMLSASTALYSLVLAGVTDVQSRDDAALAAARDPVAGAIERLAASHDDLGSRLERARADYASVAQAYVSAGDVLAILEGRLGDLSAVVAKVDGVTRSLPTTERLPAVRGSVSGGSAPTTHATTRASGG